MALAKFRARCHAKAVANLLTAVLSFLPVSSEISPESRMALRIK